MFDSIEKTGLYLEKNESKILFAALTATALAAIPSYWVLFPYQVFNNFKIHPIL